MEHTGHIPFHLCLLRPSIQSIDHSSPAWSCISEDSYLLEIRYMYNYIQIINTSQGQLYENQIENPRVALISMTQAQISSSSAFGAFIAENIQCMEQFIGESGVGEICAFLKLFARRTPSGMPIMAVIEVFLTDKRELTLEDYHSEFKARLVRTQKTYNMELVKYKAGVSDGNCSVCLDEFEEEIEVVKTDCSHYFHVKCIGFWMISKTTCPLCRSKVR